MRFLLLANETGTFNTLYQVLLAEEIHYYERSNDHDRRSISDSIVIYALSCVGSLEMLGNIYYVRHHKRSDVGVTGEEEVGVEVVGPLPREGEDEYSNHHRHRKRKNDLKEGSKCARTVNVCRLLKLVGNALEELTHHVDVKSGLKRETCNREDDEGPEGIVKGYLTED